ncbi:MAG: SMP-30/gluconolactonase/LRE family protein, partial [Candidatus Cloacimonetes bacterium]|nr:SMP-30/gluconolactonase/LRE family protein [Candidatus Cloacimonadota bacterium]
MRKVYVILAVLIIVVSLNGQTLNNPESIVYDFSTEWRYISNNGNGSIIRDHNDEQYAYFYQGLGGVRGLYIHERTLYAATNLGLSIFDLNTEQLISNVSIPESVFLNDVVADDSGNLYLSDTQAHKIFKYVISSGQVSTFISTGIQSPNGMVFDATENRILLVSFRANSPIQAINLPGGEVSTVLTTTIGNLDGIGIDMNGAIYFSSWQTNSVYRLTGLSATPDQIWTGLSGPADFFLYEETSMSNTGLHNDCQIWIPKMNNNA